MRIVIDIPDDDFNAIRCEALYYIGHERLDVSVTNAFQNGKIIHQDCGDLIDRDSFRSELPTPIEDEYKYVHKLLDSAEVVVPKYRGDEE